MGNIMQIETIADEPLVAEAMRLSRAKGPQETINLALREFVARHRPKNILDLVGQNLIDPSYDIKTVRETMNRDFG